MIELALLCAFIVTVIYISIRFYRFTSVESYGILQKEIDTLTRYFIESKLIPYANIPNNDLTKEELEQFRRECIKFVIQSINASPLYNIKKQYYTDEQLAYIVDHKFLTFVKSLKGVRV